MLSASLLAFVPLIVFTPLITVLLASLLNPLFSASIVKEQTISIEICWGVGTIFAYYLPSWRRKVNWPLVGGASLLLADSTVRVLGEWAMQQSGTRGLALLRMNEIIFRFASNVLMIGIAENAYANGGKTDLALILGLVFSGLWATHYSSTSLILSRLLCCASPPVMLKSIGLAIVFISFYTSTRSSFRGAGSNSRPKSLFPFLIILFTALVPQYGLVDSVFVSKFPNSTLLSSEWRNTGLVVVGETMANDHLFRYLRVDHSLLGGLWIDQSRAEDVEDSESIYSTFVLQEIVMLVEKPKRVSRESETVLIIGLGVGISARGFHNHGLNTTIVEIDPAVYHAARTYFGLASPRGGVILEDAREFMAREEGDYDYIIHDVFTGGTVPSSLFTMECFQSMASHLAPDGIVAINYAGSTTAESFHMILSTILTSFSFCRAFEDGAADLNDYKNLLILCSNSSPITFRSPIPSDFITSPSPIVRRRVFKTFQNYEFDLNKVQRRDVLSDWNTAVIDKAQITGAKEHWQIMKEVMSERIWMMY